MLIRLSRDLRVRKELFEERRFKIETDLITNSSQRESGIHLIFPEMMKIKPLPRILVRSTFRIP